MKMGRPRKEIDFREFESLCKLQCTIPEICEWFHITECTLQARVQEQYGETFSCVYQKKSTGGKISLRRNLFKLSESNVAAAIFLAKNYLGMTDKQEIEHHGIGNEASELTDEQLVQIVSRRRSKRAIEAETVPLSVN